MYRSAERSGPARSSGVQAAGARSGASTATPKHTHQITTVSAYATVEREN